MSPSQQTEGLTAEQRIIHDALDDLYYGKSDGEHLEVCYDAVSNFIKASCPNPPAQEAVRPFGWISSVSLERLESRKDSAVYVWKDGGVDEPIGVYTSPPDQSSLIKVLTEALEGAREWLSGWSSAEPYIGKIDKALALVKEANNET